MGVWETAAPAGANLVLALEFAMGTALVGGAWLARRKRFREHGWCQAAVVGLNLAVIAAMMVPAFREQVWPKLPGKIGKAYYAVATTHAALGSLAEIAALYVVLSAGTNLLPERFRIRRYKVWMKSVLVLWWAVLLLGTATYVRWYVPLR